MPKTTIDVPNVGTVFITKKRGQRTMRLRVDTKGQVQISMPWLAPRGQAINFILAKIDWIQEQQRDTSFVPYNGMLLGKTLQLLIRENSNRVRVEYNGKQLVVHFAKEYDSTSKTHLIKIEKAIMTALRNESEKILLPRLRELADMYGFSYASSSIKQVIGRWGSCDSKKHITLSIFLIQLPIEFIDYVLIHELSHTVHMNHSQAFWARLELACPEYKQIRKNMRRLRPKIYDAKMFMA